MQCSVNEFGQPIGPTVADWQGAARPPRTSMEGRFCRVEPLDSKDHLDDLYDAYSDDREGALWTYMSVGPFKSKEDFREWLEPASDGVDPLFHAIIDLTTNRAVGLAAYLRIKPSAGVIEVGNITYSPRLQKTAIATEAMYLMMVRVFDELGYRRYEWKCDSLNTASREAAERLGFSFDGVFEQAVVYKGRNRDTAWYSILDRDWPALKSAYVRWLDPGNFDEQGLQRRALKHFVSQESGPRESSD